MINDPEARLYALLAAWRADIDSEPQRVHITVDDGRQIVSSTREHAEPAPPLG